MVLLPEILREVEPRRVLHFAPEPILKCVFETPGVTYETADLKLLDVTHTNVDLQHLPFSDHAYDLIVCNHVLEHISDDTAGLTELARVLSPRGRAVITVPGDFTARQTRRFSGQLENGHYRHYGLDFVDALRSHFTHVQVRDLHELDRDASGLSRAIRPRDLAFVCA